MSARLLLLTAGFGEGHNAAARALAAAADEAHGAGTARVLDVFAAARPRTNALVRRSYLGLINRAPQLWRRVYAWLDQSRDTPAWFGRLAAELRVLEAALLAERPDVLCSTYPLYAFMLPALQRSRAWPLPPHFNVVTDSISINSLWWRVPCAGWFVPNPDSADVLLRAGVAPERVQTCGFPVSPDFMRHASDLAAPSESQRPRVLYIINSGTRGAAETAFRLLEHNEWEITCTVGRNDPLRARLETAARRRTGLATILGWTNQIPRLLMTHHVVISKAGGATTQEAIAARCPMIVNQIVPGQEEGNYELLRRHGIGALAPTPDAVVDSLNHAFANDAAAWRQWRAAVVRLSRPAAARDIIERLLPAGAGAFTPALHA